MADFIVVPKTVRDLTGRQFGRLRIIAYAGPNIHGQASWRCICDCGQETVVVSQSLTKGDTQSCGCLAKELAAQRRQTHGMTRRTPEYGIWCGMRRRCYDANEPAYPRYGGRGILVCDRWLGRNGFANFLADMGLRTSPDHELERVDNAGPYSPENCKWATRTEQGRNKRNNRLVTFRGETLPLSVWAERTGLPYKTLHYRISKGWSAERTLTTPLMFQS